MLQPASSPCSQLTLEPAGPRQGAHRLSFTRDSQGSTDPKGKLLVPEVVHKNNQTFGVAAKVWRLSGLTEAGARSFKRWCLPDSDTELGCGGKCLKYLQISVVWEMSFPRACTIHFISRNQIYAHARERRSRLVPLGVKLQQVQDPAVLVLSVGTLSREYLFLYAGLHNRREQKLCIPILVTQKYFHFRGSDGIKSRFNTCN